MNEWPDGRTDNGNDRYGRGRVGGTRPAPAPVPPQPQPGFYDDRQGQGYGEDYAQGGGQRATGYDDGFGGGQVYGGGNGSRSGGGTGLPGGSRTAGAAPDWRKRIKVGALVLVVSFLAVSIGTYFWADSKLRRDVDLSKVIDRPSEGKGTNYLIVGSDSREGMTDEEKKALHTGSAEGKRTDSMMILHTGDNGSTLVSLPRDSNVTIPTYQGSESGKTFQGTGRQTKLNAAYAEDGPTLLVRTVEANTGLRIDHYVEIGFAGFANIVDAVGGVDINIPEDIKDSKSGADLKKGEQTLNGEQALAFVRTRYALKRSDLDRTKNQQLFLSALAGQTATPSTVLNPFKLYPVMGAGLDTLIVDKDMGLFDLASMFWAMKGVTGGDGTSMNMPLSGTTGGNLVWDKTRVTQLVEQLRNDEKVTVKGD
jgi:LCP family protein required for cell wall assembly